MRAVVITSVLLVSMVGRAGVPVFIAELANQCRFKEALTLFDQTSGGGWRSHDEVAAIRGRLLLQQERYEEVLQATAGAGPSAELQFLRGMALGQLAREAEAAWALESARRLGFDEALIEGARPLAAMRLWDYDRAEALLAGALKKDPDLSGALYNLACVRSSQGRLEEAATLVRHAWAMGWRDAPRLRNDPDLEALRRAGLIGDLLLQTEARCLTW